MDLKELKNTAFGKWIMSQNSNVARFHIYECLTTGPTDNMAWDLVEITNGTKDFPAKQIESVINKAYEELVLA